VTRYVLDTNIIAAYLKGDLRVQAAFQSAISSSNLFLGCPMVWHEVQRGLVAKGALAKMRQFEEMYNQFRWQNYDYIDWSTAADLWAKRQSLGRPISDADLLIAVFALNRKATLITNNVKDFAELGVTTENWMRE
jgi:predicted nucleic acid-binding protein